MINNCIIPIDSDIEREEIRQVLLNKPYLTTRYPVTSLEYRKLKCFYIIDYDVRCAFNISIVKEVFPGLKIINSCEILNLKELYED
jgi:hypothetical protein